MRTLTAVLTLVFLAAFGAAPAMSQQPEPQTVAAAGFGRVTLTPDQAEIFLSVERVRPTSRAARAVVNRRIAAVRRAMLARGIERSAMRTTGVSVSTERVRARRGRPARIRYHASSSLAVLSRDVPGIGRLIDAAADTGADVFGPEFGFSDPSQGEMLATRAALTDARRRADDAAAQMGMRVAGLQSIDLAPGLSEGIGGSDDSGGAGGGQDGTQVLPGEREFLATVRVVYTVTPVV